MKRKISYLLIILFVLVNLSGLYSQDSQWKLAIRVKGNVESLKAGEKEWKPIFQSRKLHDNDSIRTKANSEGKILLENGSAAVLMQNTQIQIQKLELTEKKQTTYFQQTIGKIKVHVEKIIGKEQVFEVKTPSAVLAVRGTDFTSDVAEDGTTEVEVEDGTVWVTAMDVTVELWPGMKTTITPGQPPQAPVNVPEYTQPNTSANPGNDGTQNNPDLPPVYIPQPPGPGPGPGPEPGPGPGP